MTQAEIEAIYKRQQERRWAMQGIINAPYPEACEDVSTLLAAVSRLRAVLEKIKRHGRVCDRFELCEHSSCEDSALAWLLADAVLDNRPVEDIGEPRLLFQEQLQAARQQEREACARIAEGRSAYNLAAEIRQRGAS